MKKHTNLEPSELLSNENVSPYFAPLYKFYKLYDEVVEAEDNYLCVQKKDNSGYYKINEKFLQVLESNTVWFSPPNTFNDLWDAGNCVSLVCNDSKLSNTLLFKKLKNEVLELNDSMSFEEKKELIERKLIEKFRTYRIACFTKTFQNNPMWAFYGDNHKGICLEFEFCKVTPSGTLTTDFQFLGHHSFVVKYSNNYGSIKKLNSIKDISTSILQTKHPDWSYEKEVRFVRLANNDAPLLGGTVSFSKTSLSKVIFGCRVPEEVISCIHNVLYSLKYDTVDMLKLKFNPRNPNFEAFSKKVNF